MDLPPILGRYDRTRVVIIVTGRTAVCRIGGVSAVARHVATARRLGLDPLVLYPARMKALGAEIAGEIGYDANCIPASAYTPEIASQESLVLVIAGDWYIAPAAIISFNERTHGPSVARFIDRGRTVAPLARIATDALRRLIPKLAGNPSAELIEQSAEPDSMIFSLAVAERHRLSDNIAVARCEQKLFASSDKLADPTSFRLLQRWLAIPFTKLLTRTPVTPMQVSVGKVTVGLLAAVALSVASHAAALFGSLLFFVSRLLDIVAGDLARSSLRAGSRGERFDVVGDIAVQGAIIWALAFHLGAIPTALVLALIASGGILASTFVAYRRVFHVLWEAETKGERPTVTPDNFGSRFWRRNGPAYGLLLTAVIHRLDLFLWAAAVGSHLFWILWLRNSRQVSGRT